MIKQIIILLCFLLSVTIQSEVTVRITNGEWSPFFSKDLKHGGVTSHIAEKAFALEGINVEYGWFPWKRALVYARTGAWDAAIGWAKTEEREKDLMFSDSILQGKIVFFHLKERVLNWETLDDLKGLTIGAIIGFTYSEEFIEAESQDRITVVRATSGLQNLKMLLSGRVDIFICNLDVGYNILTNNFTDIEIDKIIYNTKPFLINELRLGFSNKLEKNKRLLELFNRGLKKMKESGEFYQYYEASRKGLYKLDEQEKGSR